MDAMNDLLGRLSALVTARPYVTLGLLLVCTVVLAAGVPQRAELDETDGFFPPDSPIVQAMDRIDELFAASGQVSTTTLVFRGYALTPDVLGQMQATVDRIVADDAVRDVLLDDDPVISPAALLEAALETDDIGSVSQREIEEAAATPPIDAALTAMTGHDADGASIAIATIRLRDSGDESTQQAERRIHELASGGDGPLRVSSVSPTLIEDEYRAARDDVGSLIGLALIVLAVVILAFLRSFSDVLLTLGGLLLSIIWVTGAEGWLGPDALNLIGPPNGLTVMIPIIVISLTVDYAIQTVSHYREQRIADRSAPALSVVRTGLRHVLIPLTLAAVTTIISFLVALLSPIPAVNDFGIVAGLGVGLSLIVMLTLIPSARVILERRREAQGKVSEPRPVANALPGIERAAEALGRAVTRRPAPFFIAVAVVSIALGIAATDLESRFSIRDILPGGGDLVEDLDSVEEAVGGSTQLINILIQAEATDIRTVINMRDLRLALEDDQRRPSAAVGPLEGSYEQLAADWIEDSGQHGDRYDPNLAALVGNDLSQLGVDPQQTQVLLDELERLDPTLADHLVNDPAGIDTILVQFSAYSLDTDSTKLIQDELEAIWGGDDDSITAASESIISVAVTDEIADRQTESIATTIVVALIILAVFFWITQRQPALGVIAVAPIVLALLWVLGTMALLDIPYTLVTSMITALSIGIGVDYTIHVIHRYREEFTRLRDPEQAAVRTLATTGPALLGSALTTVLGLGVLILSPVLSIQEFGITAAITIAYALIVSIVLVPPAMTVWGAFQNMRLRSRLERLWAESNDAAEQDA